MKKLQELIVELLLIALAILFAMIVYRIGVHIYYACPNTGMIFISCGPYSLY